MPTKVIVLGEEDNSNIKKQIKFTHLITKKGHILVANNKPDSFGYIELITKNFTHFEDNEFKDLMFAYNDPHVRQNGILYLGKFNDGVV